MKTSAAFVFVSGFILGAALLGALWYAYERVGMKHPKVEQIPFDSRRWKEGNASVRGQMYEDLVRRLESERPRREAIEELLGPPGNTETARPNAADVYFIYQIDLGQRLFTYPLFYKLGIAFQKGGSYSHSSVWD